MAALKEEAEGSTHVLFTVLPTGEVTDVAISKASGLTPAHQALDKSAAKAIAGCVFAEAPGFGPREVLQPIIWQLEPSAEAGRGSVGKVSNPSIERPLSGAPTGR